MFTATPGGENAAVEEHARMHQIRPGLWLGSIDAVGGAGALQFGRIAKENDGFLEQHNITKVLTCGRYLGDPTYPLPSTVERVMHLEIDDLDEVDILEHLPTTSDVIRDALCIPHPPALDTSGVLGHAPAAASATAAAAAPTGGILVHCASGRSRSASVVIAYLMREEKLSYEAAYSAVESIRPEIQPTSGFCHQLKWYQEAGCPRNLCDSKSGQSYKAMPEFVKLLRKYTAADVIASIVAAGVADANVENCHDLRVLQLAIDALDRLQNAVPFDDGARDERRSQNRKLNAQYESLQSGSGAGIPDRTPNAAAPGPDASPSFMMDDGTHRPPTANVARVSGGSTHEVPGGYAPHVLSDDGTLHSRSG